MSARLYESSVVRDFKRPYKPIHIGGFPRWRVMHDGQSSHGLGRKKPRRGWKQHYAKFPQRGLAHTLLMLTARRDAKKKVARAKTK